MKVRITESETGISPERHAVGDVVEVYKIDHAILGAYYAIIESGLGLVSSWCEIVEDDANV